MQPILAPSCAHRPSASGEAPPLARHARRLALAAALAAAALPAAAQAPKAPGTFGIELVVEDPGPGASDFLTILSVQGVAPAAFVPPLANFSLSTDIDGNGALDVIKINGAENGTSWQVATAPEMTIAIDPGPGTPIVFLPVRVPTLGNLSAIAIVDMRAGIGAAAVGAFFSAGLSDVPLQILDDGNGRVYVAESNPGGPMVVSEITFGGGATPVVTAQVLVAGSDAEFQDRMALGGGGAGGASLSVPHTAGIDVYSVPGLALLGTVPMPTNAAGTAYVPYTNVVGGLPGPFDMLLFAGQPGGGAGHTYVSWSSATGAAGPTGGIDPAGAALRPAPGFHEPAFTSTGAATGTVTGLLDTFPFGSGAGAVLQIPVGPAGPGGSVVTTVVSPFGDPEPARNGLSDPIGFQSATATLDFFTAVSAGAFAPIGAVSGSVPLTGFLNPGDSPRPLAMSFPGFPGSDFAVTTTIGTPRVHLFTVGAGPAVTAATVLPAGSGATSLGTVYSQGAVGGPLPVHFRQFSGPAGGVALHVGAPLAVPPLSFLAADLNGIPAMPFSGFVGVPPAQGAVAGVSPAQTSLNFGLPGVQSSWTTLHPSPAFLPPAPGFATIAPGPSYGAAAAFYASGAAFVTEFASY